VNASVTATDICWELQPGPWPSFTLDGVDPVVRIVDLEHERDAYREELRVCLSVLNDVLRREREHDDRYRRLLEEHRRVLRPALEAA